MSIDLPSSQTLLAILLVAAFVAGVAWIDDRVHDWLRRRGWSR